MTLIRCSSSVYIHETSRGHTDLHRYIMSGHIYASFLHFFFPFLMEAFNIPSTICIPLISLIFVVDHDIVCCNLGGLRKRMTWYRISGVFGSTTVISKTSRTGPGVLGIIAEIYPIMIAFHMQYPTLNSRWK